MANNFFKNGSLLAKTLGISRTSLNKAVITGKISKTVKGFNLNCEYIKEKAAAFGCDSFEELQNLDKEKFLNKKNKSKKPVTKKSTSSKKSETEKTGTEKPASGKNSELYNEKLRGEIALLGIKQEEAELKLKKSKGDLMDRTEMKNNYAHTIRAIDSGLRNSSGSGVGEKYNRLAASLEGKPPRERIAAYNNLHTKFIVEGIEMAYDLLTKASGELDT